MTRKKGQVRLSLESLEDRMVLSSMGVLPPPTDTPPPALMSSSQLPGGQLPGSTTTGTDGQEHVIMVKPGTVGSKGQLPDLTTTGANDQLPGLTTTGTDGQEHVIMVKSGTARSTGQEQVMTKSSSNGQLPDFGQLPGTTMTGANDQLPGSANGEKGQEHILMMKSGTDGAKGQEQVVQKSGANGQQPGLTTTDRVFSEMGNTFGASDHAIGQKAS